MERIPFVLAICSADPATRPSIRKGRASVISSAFRKKKAFLPAVVDLDVDPAIVDFRDAPLAQRNVAGAPSWFPGYGIAAHHGTSADVNRLADFEGFKTGFRILVAACAATREDDHNEQDDHPLLHGTLDIFRNGVRSGKSSADSWLRLSRPGRPRSRIVNKSFYETLGGARPLSGACHREGLGIFSADRTRCDTAARGRISSAAIAGAGERSGWGPPWTQMEQAWE